MRAYKVVTEPIEKFWCDYCETWYVAGDEWTKLVLYEMNGAEYEFSNRTLFEDYTSWEVYICDSCNNQLAPLDERPSTEIRTAKWVCGNCKSEYDDDELAADCCE